MKQISLFHEVRTLTFDIEQLYHRPGARFSAPFVSRHRLSLFLFASRSHVHLPDWTTRDVTSCITCMFPGALLSLLDSLCVSPRLFSNGPFRETSFAAGKRPVHPRTFHSFYNRKSRHPIIILLPKKKASCHESARLSRISQTLSNQPYSLESARLSQDSSHGIQRILAHGFLPPSHCPPQLPTASGLSRAASSAIKGLLGLIRVCGLVIVRAPGPLLIVV